jgi:hypothetical protein
MSVESQALISWLLPLFLGTEGQKIENKPQFDILSLSPYNSQLLILIGVV